jgi:hypothetical protein
VIGFLLFVLIIVLAVLWLKLRERLNDIEHRLDELSASARASADPELVVDLAMRVARLEQHAGVVRRPEPKPAAPVFVPPTVEPAPLEPAPTPEPAPVSAPCPALAERLRAWLGNEEWEALVGGNLLNKIGALVLVVGIALFLAYSFAHLTPAGRTLTAFLLSGALLGLGVWLGRKQTYRVFSRGLIGAGWAGLYATAYAMHAVPAARIIQNPFLGSLLLLAVAAGMIGHSLRYRVQALTAIAYFAAFAALAVGPVTLFAVVALIPLASTLLYLAWRFNWSGMAVFGLVATYATCLSRGSSDAPLLLTESLFAAYWLLFECFDLLRIRARAGSRAAALIFPLNAAGFLGLSFLAWAVRAPDDRWLLSAIAAAFYLAGALARAWLRPPSSFPGASPFARYEQGSYEAPLTLSAFLAGLAVVGKVSGVWMAVALAIEAELLYLAGVRLGSRFLRALGGVAFGFSLGRLWLGDLDRGEALLFGHGIRAWTPAALFHAALFYLNRFLDRRVAAFSWLAAVLIAAAVGAEVSQRFVGAAWLVMAAVLFEFGLRKRMWEFRAQAYGLTAVGVTTLAMVHLLAHWPRPWISLSLGLAIAYGYSLRTARLAHGRVGPREGYWLQWSTAAATLVLGLALLYRVVPPDYLGLAWWLLGLLLFECGLRKLPERLRPISYAAAALASLTVIASHAGSFSKFAPHPVWISYFGAGACAWLMAIRAWLAGERHLVERAAPAVATLFTLAGIWIVAPREVVPAAWAVFSLALHLAGRWIGTTDLRPVSYSAAMLAFLHLWTVNFPSVEETGGVSARLLATGAVVGVFYAAEFLTPRAARARGFFSVLATLLLAGLLWCEVSGSVLTVALGIQGLALLAAGFPAHERPLRLAGLALLLFCISKLFLYDLRHLETLYRILSFLTLGLILVGVSWIYTRFRDAVRRELWHG